MKRMLFTIRNSALTVMTTISIVLGVSTAHADHDINVLEAKAEATRVTMLEMHHQLVRYYVRSRIFGELMATSGQIQGKSAHLRVMAKYGGRCDWPKELRKLDDLVCRLDALLEEARYRSLRGLDPPIDNCFDTIDRKLAILQNLVLCMKDVVGYEASGIEPPNTIAPPRIAPPKFAPAVPPVSRYREYGGDRYRHHSRYGNWSGDGGYRFSGRQGGNLYFDSHGLAMHGRNGLSFRINF